MFGGTFASSMSSAVSCLRLCPGPVLPILRSLWGLGSVALTIICLADWPTGRPLFARAPRHDSDP